MIRPDQAPPKSSLPVWTPSDSYTPTVRVEHPQTRDEQAAQERRIIDRAETDTLIKTMLNAQRPPRAARRAK